MDFIGFDVVRNCGYLIGRNDAYFAGDYAAGSGSAGTTAS